MFLKILPPKSLHRNVIIPRSLFHPSGPFLTSVESRRMEVHLNRICIFLIPAALLHFQEKNQKHFQTNLYLNNVSASIFQEFL